MFSFASLLLLQNKGFDLSNPKGENDQLCKGLINQAPTMKFENKSFNLGSIILNLKKYHLINFLSLLIP
jgi:hypothetical protein